MSEDYKLTIMKEFSIEQKAKRYDEAMNELRDLHDNYNEISRLVDFKQELERIFPELIESEEERIRKEIINYFEYYPNIIVKKERRSDWIAWLEKQGKKPMDKVEPKFHEGDIIIHKELGGDYIHNPHKIIQVDILDKKYRLEGGLVAHFGEQDDYELVEPNPAWSEEVQEEQVSEEFINSLDTMLNDGLHDRYLVSEERIKKSAELLFSIARKQLNNEMQEWSEEDEDNFKHLLDEIVCLGNNKNSANRLYYDRLIKFIIELKNRAQPKEKWCDKDERMLDRLIAYFEKQVAFTEDDNPRYANWLKSLRPQSTWKPSDEQMKALWEVYKGGEEQAALASLYSDLKKLKSE